MCLNKNKSKISADILAAAIIKLTFYEEKESKRVFSVEFPRPPSPLPPPETHTQFFISVSNQNIRRTITRSFLGLTAVWLLGSRPVLPTPPLKQPPCLFVAVAGSEGSE